MNFLYSARYPNVPLVSPNFGRHAAANEQPTNEGELADQDNFGFIRQKSRVQSSHETTLDTFVPNWQKLKRLTCQLAEKNSSQDRTGVNDIKRLANTTDEQLHQLIFKDELTGLRNRRCCFRDLKKNLSKANESGQPFTLVNIDSDGLKKVNDTFGHGVGDDYIRVIAETMRNTLPKNATAYRLGGDEFVLLLENSPAEEAATTLKAILNKMPLLFKPVDADGKPLAASPVFSHPEAPEIDKILQKPKIQLSAGLFTYHPNKHQTVLKDADTLIAISDKAMYHIKNNDGNGIAQATLTANTQRTDNPADALDFKTIYKAPARFNPNGTPALTDTLIINPAALTGERVNVKVPQDRSE
ncbi:MAG: GGDEF domain-containing protein [Vampirovibrio sp.]|nr:GGDEF domain-containing protein [Vampirovibrio sp.]